MDWLLAYVTYQPVQRWSVPIPGLEWIGVSPHGVGTALGFLLGAMLMARLAEPRGIPRPEVINAVTWGFVGAILGARGFYVLAHLDSFGSLRDVLAVWEGGLTMFGGFVGGLALGLGYLWRRGFDLRLAADAAAPGFVVGVAVGRIGDLIIADHLGGKTDFQLGYIIPEGADLAPGYGPPTYVPGEVVHPTALYDLIGVGALAVLLAIVARRRPHPGVLFGTFCTWYGLQRLLLDFTRNRETIESSYFGLSGSQWAGILFALAGLALIATARQRSANRAAAGLAGAVAVGVPAGAVDAEAEVSSQAPLVDEAPFAQPAQADYPASADDPGPVLPADTVEVPLISESEPATVSESPEAPSPFAPPSPGPGPIPPAWPEPVQEPETPAAEPVWEPEESAAFAPDPTWRTQEEPETSENDSPFAPPPGVPAHPQPPAPGIEQPAADPLQPAPVTEQPAPGPSQPAPVTEQPPPVAPEPVPVIEPSDDWSSTEESTAQLAASFPTEPPAAPAQRQPGADDQDPEPGAGEGSGATPGS
ncbi:MAG TPA: prolipoprotein diacylglyceryl transferase family protein [Actinomycetota bacterium]|nr:prolipoprotein diacylglyceryl transferase family protein [Actinomycetota bacterium]